MLACLRAAQVELLVVAAAASLLAEVAAGLLQLQDIDVLQVVDKAMKARASKHILHELDLLVRKAGVQPLPVQPTNNNSTTALADEVT